MEKRKLQSIDLSKLSNKTFVVVSSQESLIDVIPIDWNEEVLSGNKQIIVEKGNFEKN